MATRSQRGINPYATYAGPTTGPTVFSTCAATAATTTTGTDTTPSVTETYIAEVYVPLNATLTGVSILNGSSVAGNVEVVLYADTGDVLAQSASTAQSGAAAYQQVPFLNAYAAKGPGKYFVGLQCNNTGARFRTHILGNAGAGKTTGDTYGTFPKITPPTTFTTGVGPVAQTY